MAYTMTEFKTPVTTSRVSHVSTLGKLFAYGSPTR